MAAAAPNNHLVKNLVKIATDYTEYIKEKYRRLYKFIGPENNPGTPSIYTYTIKTLDDKNVGSVEIVVTLDESIQGPIKRGNRNSNHITNELYIRYLHINPQYQLKGLGTILLLYGICDLYKSKPVYIDVTLDDDTDPIINKLSMKHIYIKLGFIPRNDLLELPFKSNPFKIKRQGTRSTLSGPERYTTIDHLIGAIVPRQMKIMIEQDYRNAIKKRTKHRTKQAYTKQAYPKKPTQKRTQKRTQKTYTKTFY
jgi:hypothetical protein